MPFLKIGEELATFESSGALDEALTTANLVLRTVLNRRLILLFKRKFVRPLDTPPSVAYPGGGGGDRPLIGIIFFCRLHLLPGDGKAKSCCEPASLLSSSVMRIVGPLKWGRSQWILSWRFDLKKVMRYQCLRFRLRIEKSWIRHW